MEDARIENQQLGKAILPFLGTLCVLFVTCFLIRVPYYFKLLESRHFVTEEWYDLGNFERIDNGYVVGEYRFARPSRVRCVGNVCRLVIPPRNMHGDIEDGIVTLYFSERELREEGCLALVSATDNTSRNAYGQEPFFLYEEDPNSNARSFRWSRGNCSPNTAYYVGKSFTFLVHDDTMRVSCRPGFVFHGGFDLYCYWQRVEEE